VSRCPGAFLRVSRPGGVWRWSDFGRRKIDGVRLLLRFYDPQQGAVRIDGTDVRRMDPRAQRRLIPRAAGPVIFAASVLDNGATGGPGRAAMKSSRRAQGLRARIHRRLPAGKSTRARRAAA